LHLYNKTPAPRRKLGHLNVAASSEDELLSSLNELHEKLYDTADVSLGLSAHALANEA
jgi:phosphoribosylaminoimidazole carboxylase (NCAIR synthetase)